MIENKQLEALAALQHDIWASWMKWQFSCGMDNADGSWTMPAFKVERWKRQMNTPYAELSEREKDGDRDVIREFMAQFEAACSAT